MAYPARSCSATSIMRARTGKRREQGTHELAQPLPSASFAGRGMNRFTEFIRERRYFHNVTPATISWYTHAFKWLPSESPTQDDLKDAVLQMREKGLKETGCNAVIRAVDCLSALEQRSRAEVRAEL